MPPLKPIDDVLNALHSRKAENTSSTEDNVTANAITASNIPSDIILMIFHLCIPAQVCDVQDFEDNPSIRLKQWVKVTHVCRDWRMKALDSTSLWSAPDFSLPALAQEMMSRSKSAPLHIHVDFRHLTTTFASKVFLSALEHSAGIETLCIRTVSGQHEMELERVVSLLDKPVPLLHSLDIHVNAPQLSLLSSLVQQNPDPKHHVLPDPLLGNNAPRLRKLALTGLQPPWTSPLLRNLTSLQITQNKPPYYTSSEILHVLKEMPLLENIGLWRCLALSMPEITCDEPVTHLPRLRTLGIASTVVNCNSILNHITFPSTVELTIQPTYTSACAESQSLPVFMAWLARLFQAPSSPASFGFGHKSIRYLVLANLPSLSPNFHLQAGVDLSQEDIHEILSTYGTSYYFPQTPPFFSLTFVWSTFSLLEDRSNAVQPIAHEILNIISPPEVQILSLEIATHKLFDPNLMSDWLANCSQVQHVLASAEGVELVSKALEHAAKTRSDEFIFPNLESMRFGRIASGDHPSFGLLARYLDHRCKKGSKLQHMVIHRDCQWRNATEDLNEMRRFVERLECDGVTDAAPGSGHECAVCSGCTAVGGLLSYVGVAGLDSSDEEDSDDNEDDDLD
ncbi:hypothetical protein Moror_8842 [Moniliophthora roreri MCA 2997]|uniref:Uncharacterized protein n=2 Tax=Moniliophthora roreri TaxID=221103 RepID=V2YN79_MONRO|nr:hypothetical protein Moror_8842 [Moniliophthora roreri MCA 2997]KAI3604282.1 hypothetical protein WG66_008550 [Moniliophthora roreri]